MTSDPDDFIGYLQMKWVYDAILGRDYPVVQGGVFLIALVFVLVNLLVDVSYAYLDPRIHYE